MLIGTASSVLGKEGYHTYFEALPKPAQKWVGRTFLVYHELQKVPIGSAFLIQNEGGTEAHFLTANHVAYYCLGKGVCSLRWGAVWTKENLLSDFFISTISLDILDVMIFEPKGSSWLSASSAADVAYLKVKSHPLLEIASANDLGLNSIKSLSLQNPFQRKHFSIGYPNLAARPSYKSKLESQQVRMRWSEGEFLKLRKVGKRFQIATDLDTLPGNSGGPVIFEDGRLAGILVGGPNSYEYYEFPAMYSYVVPIDTVKLLIGDILLKKNNHISICSTPYGQNKTTCLENPFDQ